MTDQRTQDQMIRYVIVSDGAQVAEGKLFILGGGITTLWGAQAPVQHGQLSFAIRVDVPWKATTPAEHVLTLDIINVDGQSILQVKPEVRFEAGRPPGMRSEDVQTMNLALNLLGITFPEFGKYKVVCSMDGTPEVEEPLHVLPAPVTPGQPPQG